MHFDDMDARELRDLAWIGDAVLALYAREWLLRQPPHPLFTRQEQFVKFTSNSFLQAIGEPTWVEAQIGQAYQDGGLEAGYAYSNDKLKPLFQNHLAKASKSRRRQKRG